MWGRLRLLVRAHVAKWRSQGLVLRRRLEGIGRARIAVAEIELILGVIVLVELLLLVVCHSKRPNIGVVASICRKTVGRRLSITLRIKRKAADRFVVRLLLLLLATNVEAQILVPVEAVVLLVVRGG